MGPPMGYFVSVYIASHTHVLGSCKGGAPFLWNTPSINMPFFPPHLRKKFGSSYIISKCTLEMKLEWPMFTSTSPLLLFRPTEIRDWRIKYSKSLPSNLAIATPFGSGLHFLLAGLAGADWFLRANNARASLSEGCGNADITRRRWAHQNGSTRKKTIDHIRCCLHTKHSQHALLTTFARDRKAYANFQKLNSVKS